LVGIPTRWTNHIHVFRYSESVLSDLILQGKFDGIYAWEEPYIFAGYQIARLSRRSKTRYCFWTAQSLNKRYPPPFDLFEKTAVRTAYRWVAGGQTVFNNLVERGYPSSCGRVLTLAVDTAAFRATDDISKSKLRDRLGIKRPVIGFMGRFVPAKGLRILTQALQALDPALPWNLLLLGSGEMESELMDWADRRGWRDRVRIHLAKHDEVPEFLSAMDILVAPSQTTPGWKEQFGRMLIEAFACGVPVIASDSGEIPHVVGDCGLIVPEKDVAKWSAAIDTLLRNDEMRRELSVRGLARVDRFSAKQVAAQFSEFYKELVA
jgi:glycosyltransferase involved in cell wall biosynthesis